MGIGASIMLIALGAILAFATDVEVSGLDLNVVGIILMIAGLAGLLTTLLIFGPRNRRSRQVVEGPGGTTVRRTLVEE